MKRYFFQVALIILSTFLVSCAMLEMTQPDPELAAQYVLRAQKLEKQGDLPAALEQYKLASTADPENGTAKESSERLTKMLSKMADERYQLGMKYHSQGKYGLARKEFLTALKYQPDHPQASKMLVSREPQKAPKYVFHVVQPGESLSMIAKNYYGDYKKFDAIAKFNQIEDATKVKPGQRIMIPELGGTTIRQSAPKGADSTASYVKHKLRKGESISKLAQQYYGDYKQFHVIAQFNGMDDATRVKVGQIIKVPKVAGLPFNEPSQTNYAEKNTSKPDSTEQEIEMAPKEALTAQPNGDTESDDEQILAYREAGIALFDENKYEDAVFELNKAIEAAPDDERTREYLARAYFESGRALFDEHDYDAAQEAFESSLQYDPKCSECSAYIEKSKIGPLLLHRTNGINYFSDNQFDLAIGEFEKFLMNEPQDDEIRIYLSKSYFQKALADYTKGDFMAAKKGFEQAASNDSNCDKCTDYVEKSLESFKEAHYNKGIVYYNNEKLAEAISEWEKVHEIDPAYKDVDQNLGQAKKLLEKLEQIKKAVNSDCNLKHERLSFNMNSIPNITVQLVHMQGPLKGEIQELADGEIQVGRHPDCQVQFPKEMVIISRVHSRIVREGNRFKLIDQSTNGTFVNGQQIKETFLKDGDVLMFAEGGPKVSFLTQISDAPPAQQPEPESQPVPAPAASSIAPQTPPPQAQTPQVQQPTPQPAGQPPQAPPISTPAQPAPQPMQAPQPFQAQPSQAQASPPVETVKAPFAIQFGPALKSFQTLPIVIGSGTGCDFVISHPGVYEQHAQIFFSQNRYWIKDLTGMNSITIGGMHINVQAGLEPDMQLSLSEQGPKFRFLGGGRLAEVEDPLPAPPPERPTDQQPLSAHNQGKPERPEKLGQKASGLLKKFFS